MVVRDGTRDGTSYGSDEQREGHVSGRDQAVARTAAGELHAKLSRVTFRARTSRFFRLLDIPRAQHLAPLGLVPRRHGE